MFQLLSSFPFDPNKLVMNVPLHGNFELRPLGVAMGNAVSVTCA